MKNLLADLYPAMVESQNGFEQRFLYAIVKPKAMTRKETGAHVHRLQEANLHDLNEIYDAVYRDHKDGVTYTFSAEALALYDDFDNEIVNILNNKWRQGLLVNDDAEIGWPLYCMSCTGTHGGRFFSLMEPFQVSLGSAMFNTRSNS